jgi:hypothetical protein
MQIDAFTTRECRNSDKHARVTWSASNHKNQDKSEDDVADSIELGVQVLQCDA